ncbi:MAG: SpoIIE family protein phosphatase [Myxococcales bacterium]|jgi:hypothetical protein
MTGNAYIEVDFRQRAKHGQRAPGDVFLSKKLKAEDRIVSVLSDGLGSGVKASVLATLTATMGVKYATSFRDIRKSAATIMETLPVCSVRKISYSTFTIADVNGEGTARIIEHGNPPFALLRGDTHVLVPTETLVLDEWKDRPLTAAQLALEPGDRLVLFSDGVTQSGIGEASMPLGWGDESAIALALEKVKAKPDLSAGKLAQAIVDQAARNDRLKPKDDISCAVLYFRSPRRLLVMTGPPFSKERDGELVELALTYPGRKAICGGTTASIISRRLGREVTVDIADLDPEVPPASRMEGVDLITEGTLTMAHLAELLERSGPDVELPPNAVGDLLELMLESDIIEFVVGTRINEAHQDPNIPVQLDLRRNIVKKIAQLLEEKHLKETRVRLL